MWIQKDIGPKKFRIKKWFVLKKISFKKNFGPQNFFDLFNLYLTFPNLF